MGDPFYDFESYASLAEAQAAPDGVVVLSGDYRGTIFLTAPARGVACSEEALRTLLSDLDAITWMGGDPVIATITYERREIGSSVQGGDGGGRVTDTVWVHPQQIPAEVGQQAREVVLGTRDRIELALLRRERQAELDRKRAWRKANPPRSPRLRALPWDADVFPPMVPIEDDTDA